MSLKLSSFVPPLSATMLEQHEYSEPDLPEKHKPLWLCLGILPLWKDSSNLALSLELSQTQMERHRLQEARTGTRESTQRSTLGRKDVRAWDQHVCDQWERSLGFRRLWEELEDGAETDFNTSPSI